MEPYHEMKWVEIGENRSGLQGQSGTETDATFLLTVGSFLLTAEFFAYSCVWKLFCLQCELFYLQFERFCLQLSFFAYSGKVYLRSTSTDCKHRSSTVSKKA